MNYNNIYVSDIQQPMCDVMYILINENSNEDEQMHIQIYQNLKMLGQQ